MHMVTLLCLKGMHMASSWRFVQLVLLILFSVVNIEEVHGQLDANGFLSIDCGIAPNSSYSDTKYYYVSDEQFIDTGINSQISSSFITNTLPQEFLTVRSFPTGARNCYTLKALTAGAKYLIRATFLYGNYDKLNKPPIFDIYLGVNFWDTVAVYPYYPEIIATAATDYLHVCLVNKGLGNPFISSLYLRRLSSRTYQYANATQSLIWAQRTNLGPSKYFPFLSYPDDKYDRWWFTKSILGTTEISTNSSIDTDPDFETPSLIMQTAATSSSINDSLAIYWSSNNASTRFYVVLHFAEIQNATISRGINIYSNEAWLLNRPIYLKWLTWTWVTTVTSGSTSYNITLAAASNSTAPPLLNGFELYKVAPVIGVPTYTGDVTAINSIKEAHQIKKGWSGDPCVPKEYIWTGINCTSNSDDIPRITALNLSASGLTGSLSSYFGNLNALVSLDLSHNNLSGSLPDFLDQLIALAFLDISGNSKLSTTLPPGLQSKQQNGSLTYRFGGITPAPSPSPSPSPKKYIIIAIAVVVALLVIAIVIGTFFWLRWKHKQSIVPKPRESSEHIPEAIVPARDIAAVMPEAGTLYGNHGRIPAVVSPQLKEPAPSFPDMNYAPQFSFNDLKRITSDFTNTIGIGGFGSVYLGLLENGYQVAVKIRSDTSTQGAKEFLAEAKNLARVHHKNLVTLVGYCIDGNCMALVYEYMKEGSLQQKLRDGTRPLTWKQRVRIAYESALGLEYLHKGCNPPLVHRDVKTSNILLNANLEAKIADFGLSRAFTSDAISHVSTIIVGTTGYLDPDYYLSNRLTAKSDVYSFGVVLLEIVTGRPPIVAGLEGGDLTQWVRERLFEGDIESIVDCKMQGDYDINTVWKVTNLACQCTERTSSRRPTMSAVVSELKESLDLEMRRDGTSDHSVTDVSQDSTAFEMAYVVRGMPAQGPTVR